MAKKKQQSGPSELDRLEQIKKLAVIAMFSDDELLDRLVLKGGNALDLVMQVSTRASVDVDFSMRDDFPAGQREAYRDRIARALGSTFRDAGYEVFDVKMEERPDGLTEDVADFWGGYAVEFKLIEKDRFQLFFENIDNLRRHSLRLGQGQKFLIDISCFEYTEGKEAQDLDGYRIFVYSTGHHQGWREAQ